MPAKREEITANELREYLKDKRINCDCGHKHCQHNFSSTLIVTAEGQVYCHNCYY